jgi:hypothetical protein
MTEQAAFHQSPSYETALAYMDAAIKRWEARPEWSNGPQDEELTAAMHEVREWLKIRSEG